MSTDEAATSPSRTIKDPVDWARYYWLEQELEGDEQRFLAMSSLLRYQRLVVDAIEIQLRKHRLNLTDYLVLMTLQLSEDGTRQVTNLARSLMVHATTVTLATERLRKRRLLSRRPHPTDRRATLITITPTGRKLVYKATSALNAIGFGIGDAEPGQVDQLLTLLADMRIAAGDQGR
jgi:DNA-binding MarR family transcriptional regulator